jgi:hypothetical protein
VARPPPGVLLRAESPQPARPRSPLGGGRR